MTCKIVISPSAQSDILEILEFAAAQSHQYVRNFNATFDTLAAKLERFPKMYPVKYRYVRLAPVGKIPFSVAYCIDDNNEEVTIIAVFHTKRNPDIWKNRV